MKHLFICWFMCLSILLNAREGQETRGGWIFVSETNPKEIELIDHWELRVSHEWKFASFFKKENSVEKNIVNVLEHLKDYDPILAKTLQKYADHFLKTKRVNNEFNFKGRLTRDTGLDTAPPEGKEEIPMIKRVKNPLPGKSNYEVTGHWKFSDSRLKAGAALHEAICKYAEEEHLHEDSKYCIFFNALISSDFFEGGMSIYEYWDILQSINFYFKRHRARALVYKGYHIKDLKFDKEGKLKSFGKVVGKSGFNPTKKHRGLPFKFGDYDVYLGPMLSFDLKNEKIIGGQINSIYDEETDKFVSPVLDVYGEKLTILPKHLRYNSHLGCFYELPKYKRSVRYVRGAPYYFRMRFDDMLNCKAYSKERLKDGQPAPMKSVIAFDSDNNIEYAVVDFKKDDAVNRYPIAGQLANIMGPTHFYPKDGRIEMTTVYGDHTFQNAKKKSVRLKGIWTVTFNQDGTIRSYETPASTREGKGKAWNSAGKFYNKGPSFNLPAVHYRSSLARAWGLMETVFTPKTVAHIGKVEINTDVSEKLAKELAFKSSHKKCEEKRNSLGISFVLECTQWNPLAIKNVRCKKVSEKPKSYMVCTNYISFIEDQLFIDGKKVKLYPPKIRMTH